MKRKQLFIFNYETKLYLLLLILTPLLITSSCNNEEKKAEESNIEKGPVVLSTSLDSFPVLYTEWEKLVTIFDSGGPGSQVKKIVFQFNFDGGATNGQPTLNGYSARQNGVYVPSSSVITLSKASNAEKLSYPLYLGDLEFTEAEYLSLRNSTTNPPQTYLLFIPVKSTTYTNSVTYKTAWSSTEPPFGDISTLAIGGELNPSPPKDPAN